MRFAYDVTCFLIINVIFMNIIFGIIIDTFAELRDNKTTKDSDKKNKCFICNLDRHKFENMVGGFENHIEEDHNLWNYLFFMYAVKKKDETEYNGMESYVAKKIENFDITFMPANRAMCIKTDDETKDNLQNQIKNMIKKMENLNTRLSK